MHDDDRCRVCGAEPIAIVRCFAHEPFIDGRNYELICFTCANVPKTYQILPNGDYEFWGYQDPEKLKTVREMTEDGFTEREAQVSIKAIQKLVRNPKINLGDTCHVFGCLYLDSEFMDVTDLLDRN